MHFCGCLMGLMSNGLCDQPPPQRGIHAFDELCSAQPTIQRCQSRYGIGVAMIFVYDTDNNSTLCQACGVRPKYVENGVQHSYCGKTCARSVSKSSSRDASKKDNLSKSQCQLCGSPTKSNGGVCSSCARKSRMSLFVQPSLDATIKEVRLEGGTFKKHRERFLRNWKTTPETLPNVEKIYQVVVPQNYQDSYDAYRACLPDATEIRTYYSHQCICNLGTANAELCAFPSCGTCMAAKSLFHTLAFKEQFHMGRFGRGIYSYRNSALADIYATSCITSPYRVTIECSVVVREGTCGTTQTSGRESVFVDTADAILPVSIVVYKKP